MGQLSSSEYRANVTGPTNTLGVDSPSFSQPNPPSYRHNLAVGPRTSSLVARSVNAESFARNSMILESAELDPGSKDQNKEKSHIWAHLKNKIIRHRVSGSILITPSAKSLSSNSETDSERYSTRVAYTPSTITEEPLLETWGNEEYSKQLDEAVARLKNDFVSGAREMADSALLTLSSLIEAGALTANNREELWSMAVSASKELSEARPSMNAAVTSCLLRALDEIKHLWEVLDEKKDRSANDLAAMARRQFARILEKRKEASIRLGENFAERLKAYCRQVSPPRSS